jgi:hypothetical protein
MGTDTDTNLEFGMNEWEYFFVRYTYGILVPIVHLDNYSYTVRHSVSSNGDKNL